MSLASKIINTLLVLVGPIISVLSTYWGIILPAGLEGLIGTFLQLLLVLFGGAAGGAITIFVGVPAAFRLSPRRFAAAIDRALGR